MGQGEDLSGQQEMIVRGSQGLEGLLSQVFGANEIGNRKFSQILSKCDHSSVLRKLI